MLSREEIESECFGRTFARACTIANSDRHILTKQVRYGRHETIISAIVSSSTGWDENYRTSVSFDEDADLIEEYSCTCPAFGNYGGMCKHCAALALSYNKAPQKFMGYQSVRKAQTSPCLTNLMKRIDQQANEINLTNCIYLEPFLSHEARNWVVDFRIVGPQGSYIIKNISDFIDRVRAGEQFSYGKKLAFTHVLPAFTTQGRRVVELLERAVTLREQSSAAAYWRYQINNVVGRELELSDLEAIELFDIFTNQTLTVKDSRLKGLPPAHASVEEADPRIPISLQAAERDSYLIAKSYDAIITAHGTRMYVYQNDIFYRCSQEFAQCADFLKNVHNSREDFLLVAKEDMPLFCATALPIIEKHLLVHTPAEIDTFRPMPCSLEFYFDRDKRGVLCDAWAIYGEKRYPLCSSSSEEKNKEQTADDEIGPLRNQRKETKALTLLERYFGSLHPSALLDFSNDEAIAALIMGGLAEFRSLGTVFATPAFDALLRDTKPQITMGVSLTGNLINLTVSAGDLPAAELGALLSSYRKRKTFHRLRNGVFLNIEDFDLAQLDRLASDLGLTSKQLSSGTIELPAYRALYLDEEADLERDRSFTRYVEAFRCVDETSYQLPPSLESTLRPYQAEGFRWLSARCDANFGGILADEMGLGKSIQLISLLLARQDEARKTGPSLIACPASLVYNWLAEFERFAPELSVCAVTGTKRERAKIRAVALDKSEPCDVLVTSYDLLRIDSADYTKHTFFCFAIDEAQYIKNPATLITRAVKRVESLHRFALTGTPMENRLSELWSIFDFLMPGLLGPYSRFREHFEAPIIGGDENVSRRLQSLVGPFMLRRLKSHVLRDLPEKLESFVYTPLEKEQQRLYGAHEQQLREDLTTQHNDKNKPHPERSKVEVLAELTKLRQLCCDPRLLYENYTGHAAKLDTIMELIESSLDAGEKTLVFSQFTSFLALIAECLDKHNLPYYTITGATPKKKRLELVNAFNEDQTPVFLISLKAGGTGLNLTGASVVIHADPWWNAAAQNQATDRAHRIGQTRVVNVVQVIAKDTIEERIVKLQQAKSDLASQVIGASGISLATLSREDLLDLLQK